MVSCSPNQRFKWLPLTFEKVWVVNWVVTKGIENVFNTQVVETEPPEDIHFATCFNRDQDSINAVLFEEHCEETYQRDGNTDDTNE